MQPACLALLPTARCLLLPAWRAHACPAMMRYVRRACCAVIDHDAVPGTGGLDWLPPLAESDADVRHALHRFLEVRAGPGGVATLHAVASLRRSPHCRCSLLCAPPRRVEQLDLQACLFSDRRPACWVPLPPLQVNERPFRGKVRDEVLPEEYEAVSEADGRRWGLAVAGILDAHPGDAHYTWQPLPMRGLPGARVNHHSRTVWTSVGRAHAMFFFERPGQWAAPRGAGAWCSAAVAGAVCTLCSCRKRPRAPARPGCQAPG